LTKMRGDHEAAPVEVELDGRRVVIRAIASI